MKRFALAFATLATLTAGSFAANAAPPNRHAGPGPSASQVKPNEKEPPPSIPYDADGPAYVQGQTRSTDFQLQH